ncbi:MAG: helix-turn-helix domain-containing protein [Acidimicrobiales bacterium]|nr:helix-turn-helix domain-containing protein [Acidimicrobiales bacterium]
MPDRHAQWLTVKEVAERIGAVERTVFELVKRGELDVHRSGGSTRIAAAKLDRYLASARIKPGTLPPGTHTSQAEPTSA